MKLLGKAMTEAQERMILAWFVSKGEKGMWDLWQPYDDDPQFFDAEQQAYLRRIQDVVERSGVTTWQQAVYVLRQEDIIDRLTKRITSLQNQYTALDEAYDRHVTKN